MSKIPKDYIKKKSVTIPFGYEVSEIKGYLKPIPKQLKSLNKYLKGIYTKAYSLREASTLLSEETGRKISHVGLQKYLEKDLWDIFPEDYETNKDGSFVLTESGKPKKKTGRPKGVTSQYNYSAEQKRKIKLRQQKAKLKKEKQRLARQEKKIKTEEKVITKVTEDTSSKLVTED